MHTPRGPAPDEYPGTNRATSPVGLQRVTGLSPEIKAALDALSPSDIGAARMEVPFRASRDARISDSPEPTRSVLDTPDATHRSPVSLRRPATSRVVILGLLAIVLVETFLVIRYVWTRSTNTPDAAITESLPAAEAIVPAVPENQLLVSTPTPGAMVYIDGRRYGSSPVTVTGVTPGTHQVRVEAGSAFAEQEVSINAGSTTLLMTPVRPASDRSAPGRPSSGWIAVSVPAEVQILERGTSIGSSLDGPLALSAGAHRLELRSDELGYRQELEVTVPPGDIARLRPVFPDGVLQVNAQPWASVWVDGKAVGDTPLGNLRVALGPHQVRFSHPELGEQVRNVIVTATGAARVSVDLRR